MVINFIYILYISYMHIFHVYVIYFIYGYIFHIYVIYFVHGYISHICIYFIYMLYISYMLKIDVCIDLNYEIILSSWSYSLNYSKDNFY